MAFTFFFRDLPVLEHAVNAVLKLALGRLRIKVWDAGCALGQEPYTLAILFAEKMGDMGFNTLYLDATDYDIETISVTSLLQACTRPKNCNGFRQIFLQYL